ncbi:uncharacterized protein LOC129774781 [Toxorhynchites rutilus septentrionalis]|uniref:uncharacterized protein LOC129774781 n=1 Tax=Toxorhynchites rutilus septentrionalis TaxID=329112 RepID=UPI002479B036|nr:uncharacterized protein LOC129774781 [Toxorhynchites rutilus septentrionalis]
MNKCVCVVFSPNSIDGNSCRKCNFGRVPVQVQKAQKKQNSSKYKDASTSPKSNSPLRTLEPKSPRSPRSPRAEASTDTKFDFPCSPKTESHYKRLSTLSINAGNKSVATSPMPISKLSPNKLTPVKSDRVLEKSNSLGESKPQKLLRTTRSLSPRPPVKHQHSIMVSDENDIVSVKLSPNEEYDEIREKEKKQDEVDRASPLDTGNDKTASPNLSDCGSLQLDDGKLKSANNRSTSCLIYVPSDPWTRMSASNSPSPTTKKEHKSKKLENKSFSRPDLEQLEDTNPWVWRSNITLNGHNLRKKGSLPHQTKSLGNALGSRDELLESRQTRLCQQRSLTRFDKTLTIPGIDMNFDARKKITRPKLQRSKSPAFYEEFFQAETEKTLNKSKSVSSSKIAKNASNSNININGFKCSCCESNSLSRFSNGNNAQHKCEHSIIHKSTTSITSPTAKKQPSPKLSIPQSPKPKQQSSPQQQQTNQPELVKTSLIVLNPNLLQPRHSFSTPPSSQKEEELQLNIRRLSEQMNKYNSSSYFSQTTSPSFMNDTIPLEKKKAASGGLVTVSNTAGTATDSQKRASSHSQINEPILETRC